MKSILESATACVEYPTVLDIVSHLHNFFCIFAKAFKLALKAAPWGKFEQPALKTRCGQMKGLGYPARQPSHRSWLQQAQWSQAHYPQSPISSQCFAQSNTPDLLILMRPLETFSLRNSCPSPLMHPLLEPPQKDFLEGLPVNLGGLELLQYAGSPSCCPWASPTEV